MNYYVTLRIVMLTISLAAFSSICKAYSYRVLNLLNEPIDVEIKLMVCPGSNPKGRVEPFQIKELTTQGAAKACCLKEGGLAVNGKNVSFSPIKGKGGVATYFLAIPVPFIYCGSKAILIRRDEKKNIIGELVDAAGKHACLCENQHIVLAFEKESHSTDTNARFEAERKTCIKACESIGSSMNVWDSKNWLWLTFDEMSKKA